jgi:hypothetical protein
MGRASILLAVSRILRDASSSRSRGHLAHIFNPGRAMRLCSADLSPQALMRARCPHSLVENRRCEAASPYHVGIMEQDAPRTDWDRMSQLR